LRGHKTRIALGLLKLAIAQPESGAAMSSSSKTKAIIAAAAAMPDPYRS